MAIPAWFDSQRYFDNKLVQMGDGWDTLTLKAAFESAGYSTDAAGLYKHFQDYGAHEGVSPSSLFNDAQYYNYKGIAFFNTSSVSAQQLAVLKGAFANAGMSAWEHYQGYWDERSNGQFTNNPSQQFDTQKYMAAKLATMTAGYTMDQLIQDFKDAGLTPLEHYEMYGKTEGLKAYAVEGGQSFDLTSGIDTIVGTNGNDYIFGTINTLGDEDYIYGGGGIDTLYANINATNLQNVAIQPRVLDVENLIFRVQQSGTGKGDNLTQAQIDAGNITHTDQNAVLRFKSDNSRATLEIEDVRWNSNQTIVSWADSDPGAGVDYNFYFDAQHLKAASQTTSGTLRIELMDVANSQDKGVHSLQDNVWNTFTFNYTPSGSTTAQLITLKAASGYTGADATIDTLIAAFQASLAASEWADLFTISREAESYIATASSGGESWRYTDGHRIVITAKSGTVAPARWSVDGDSSVPAVGGISWGYLEATSVDCPLIVTTIELDNVGRVQWTDRFGECLPDESIWGSESGDMVVGSMAGRGGVERFDVLVDRGSWLTSLSSTNETLRMVTVDHADINGDGKAGYNVYAQANDEGRGQLYIGASLREGSNDIGDWTDAPRLLATDGLVDVKEFDASGFAGKINLGASITEHSFQKYLRDVDGKYSIANKYAPRGDFNYNFGSNDDALNMWVDGGIAADRDFKLVVHGNDGDDLINFRFDSQAGGATAQDIANTTITARELLNINALRSVVLNGDAGKDTIKVWGDSAVTANGGAGNDAIYVGQLGLTGTGLTAGTGVAGTVGDQDAVWVFNANPEADRAIFVTEVQGAQPLNNDILSTVSTLAYTNAAANEVIQVRVNFKGIFSGWVNVQTHGATAGGGSISTDVLNHAIIDAIMNNEVLNKVLFAGDGAGYSLMIQSLIDGQMTLADLTLQIRGNATGSTFGSADFITYYTTQFANEGFAAGAVTDPTETLNTASTATTGEVDNVPFGAAFTALRVGDRFDFTEGGDTYHAIVTAAANNDAMLVNAIKNAVNSQGQTYDAVGGWSVSDDATATDGIVLFTNKTVNTAGLVNVTAVTPYATTADVTGTNDGTVSLNRVNGGSGDDVIVLNVSADKGTVVLNEDANHTIIHDTLIINETTNLSMGHDTVFNFFTGIDQIDITSLLNINANATNTPIHVVNETVGSANAAVVANGGNHLTAANGGGSYASGYTVKDFVAWANATAANAWGTTGETGVYFMLDNDGSNPAGVTNKYTVFRVVEDAAAALTDAEVTLLGTITLDNTHNVITSGANGDFYVYS